MEHLDGVVHSALRFTPGTMSDEQSEMGNASFLYLPIRCNICPEKFPCAANSHLRFVDSYHRSQNSVAFI
jgi:hypothetical protein